MDKKTKTTAGTAGDSLVRKVSIETCSQESRHFSDERFNTLRKKKICPIEVKSSGYNSHKSFDYFIEKYPIKVEDRFIIYTKDLKIRRWNHLYSAIYDKFYLKKRWNYPTVFL